MVRYSITGLFNGHLYNLPSIQFILLQIKQIINLARKNHSKPDELWDISFNESKMMRTVPLGCANLHMFIAICANAMLPEQFSK
jgi:hypothetical protein